MANVLIEETSMENIADAIRSKNGLTTKYKPAEMADAISAISGGGITPTGTKTINITQNGTTTENVTNYASAEISVNVPNSYSVSDEGKVVSNGALVAQSSQNITANGTYDTTLKNSVVVNVPQGITPSGSQTFTENGTYDVASIAEAVVNVAGSGGVSIDDWAETGPTGDITINTLNIRDSAFFGCTSLEKVTITGAATNSTMKMNAFRNSSVTELIAHKLLSTPDGFLQGCTSLTKVTTPKCVYFNRLAFNGCSALKVVDCNIGVYGFTADSEFTNCTVFDTLINRSNTLASLNNVTKFNGTPFNTSGKQGTLYVHSSLVNSYKTATNWSTLYNNGTMQILPIEGSIYETQYADGTPIE